MTDTYVYAFADAADVPRELLGGKGAGLADMTKLGLPVPDGFTITTAACVHAMHSGGEPRWRSVAGAGSARTPLRCSCRCAAARRSRCPG
jgi:hypothetical protein